MEQRTRPLVEQTDFQCIDNLMIAWNNAEKILVNNGSQYNIQVLVGPYGMMSIKTVVYGPAG